MWEKELLAAIEAGKRASVKIMEIYRKGFDVEIKSDQSPVTEADKLADKIIYDYLRKEFPNHAFLTEESDDNLNRLKNDFVWIIDPVDGTKNFVARDDEFTTNIALAYKHEIVVGVVVVPAKNEMYFASKGNGAFHVLDDIATQIHVNDKLEDLTVLISVFHSNEKEKALIEKYKDKITKIEKFGSSIKACRIAAGLAEVTFRESSGTKEWDTAASDIIVTEAGGIFVEPDGKKLTYNRKDVYNRNGYIICNRKENILR
ncbi:MAG: 3'(2'),5'-bisphosphate nucleotidase CysQ [Bacilli bacterium]|jgi:3'(2'), 5'-bisphosphate nucleotidase|nr:3'(2'),5'-bisphosphate nucleotidase CysQ [Bacilli bacterium]